MANRQVQVTGPGDSKYKIQKHKAKGKRQKATKQPGWTVRVWVGVGWSICRADEGKWKHRRKWLDLGVRRPGQEKKVRGTMAMNVFEEVELGLEGGTESSYPNSRGQDSYFSSSKRPKFNLNNFNLSSSSEYGISWKLLLCFGSIVSLSAWCFIMFVCLEFNYVLFILLRRIYWAALTDLNGFSNSFHCLANFSYISIN